MVATVNDDEPETMQTHNSSNVDGLTLSYIDRRNSEVAITTMPPSFFIRVSVHKRGRG